MSLWGSFGSFFKKVGSELEKLFGKSGLSQVIQAVITYVAPILTTIVQLAAGTEAATAVGNVIHIVQADLATISALVQAGTPEPGSTTAQSIATAANSVKLNLSGLLQVAAVKNSGKQTEISAAVNLITQEMDALLAQVPFVPATTTHPQPAATQSK